jgi:hypothetical protein
MVRERHAGIQPSFRFTPACITWHLDPGQEACSQMGASAHWSGAGGNRYQVVAESNFARTGTTQSSAPTA